MQGQISWNPGYWTLEMRIYQLTIPAQTSWLVGADDSSLLSLWFDGTPRSPTWGGVRAAEENSFTDGVQARRDMPWLNETAIALPSTESDLLGLLAPWGELLPVISEGATDYLVFNALEIVTGALVSTPEAAQFVDGNVFSATDSLLRDSAVRDKLAFRLAEAPQTVLFNDDFVSAVDRSGISGPDFRLIYFHE